LGDIRLHANILLNLAVVEEHRGQLDAAAARYAVDRAIERGRALPLSAAATTLLTGKKLSSKNGKSD
jgi:hypothetical protein